MYMYRRFNLSQYDIHCPKCGCSTFTVRFRIHRYMIWVLKIKCSRCGTTHFNEYPHIESEIGEKLINIVERIIIDRYLYARRWY